MYVCIKLRYSKAWSILVIYEVTKFCGCHIILLKNNNSTIAKFNGICDRIWENQPVSEKKNFFFVALLPFTSSEDAAVQI